ncbi:MAG TPA: GYF domain-containing protein [Polyangiaceae bacterium]|nr:GYF domain-containing protein [Polyangiaceae bacterium]
MKFLCPSCKAKYHVADEKIAGRSLRMKCRKCEFLISLSDAPPAPPTLAPSDGELVLPKLPRPPALPDLGTSPPWAASQSVARAAAPSPVGGFVTARSHGAAAIAMVAPAALADEALAVDEALQATPEEWFVEIKGAPSGPLPLSELRQKAGSGEVTLRSLVWRDGDEAWRPLSSVPELVAIVEEQLSSVHAAVAPPPLPASPKSSERPRPHVDHAAEDLAAAGLSQRRLPLAAYLAVAVAMMLGLTIGFVLFDKGEQPTRVVQASTPAPEGTPGASAAAAGAEFAPPPPAVETASASTPPQSQQVARATPRPSGKPATEAVKDLSALSAGQAGPSNEAPAGAAGPLDSATIESTVARYKASVKRSCWQPALEARADNAPTSARVNVTITVAPSGNVQNVTTSGDPKGYPGLTSCIAGRVRGWQFPPSGSSTTVNVPFVFAGQ